MKAVKRYLIPVLILLPSLFMLLLALAIGIGTLVFFLVIVVWCAVKAITITKNNRLKLEEYFCSRMVFLLLTVASVILAIYLFPLDDYNGYLYSFMVVSILMLIRIVYVIIFTKTIEEKEALLLAEPQILVTICIFLYIVAFHAL